MPHHDQLPCGGRLSLRLATLVMVGLAAALTLTSLPSPLAAQSKPSAAKSKKPTSQSATKSYEDGVKAFDKGKVKNAVTSLSAALRQGGLPPQQMAKALFYRGTAYRKQKKPAQAISDLTSAIWIKGGLSDADRLSAIEQRKAAYKEAGLGTNVPQGLQPGASVPSTAVATSVPVSPSPVAAPPAPVTSAASGTATSAWTTTAGAEPPVATQKVAKVTPPSSPTPAPFSALTPTITPTPPPSTTVSTMPRNDTAPTTQTSAGVGTTVSNIGNSISTGFSNVGSFFGNMFSSNSSASASSSNQGAQIATSSTQRAPQLSMAQQHTATDAPAVTQGWNSATQPIAVAPSPTPRPVRTAALPSKSAPVASTKPQSTSARSGKFRLQVAAVRSEEKAQQVVAVLNNKYASELGGARPEIDAAAIGNMGTFYRVRVGPYANTKEPQGLCARLKPDGYDCLIVTP